MVPTPCVATFMALGAGLKIRRGAVFGAKAGWQGATKENTLHGSLTEEQRRQPAFAAKTLPPSLRLRRTSRAAGLLLLGFVGARVTARCGDAPPAPPNPKSKSLAAAPLPIFRQALSAINVAAHRADPTLIHRVFTRTRGTRDQRPACGTPDCTTPQRVPDKHSRFRRK